jgi:hypothetical protein
MADRLPTLRAVGKAGSLAAHPRSIAILAPGQRTVSSALRAMGLGQGKRFYRYHRVLTWLGIALMQRNGLPSLHTPHYLKLNRHLGSTAGRYFQRPPRRGRLADAELHQGALGRQAGKRCLTSSGSPPLVPVRGDLEVHLWRRC